MNKKAWISKLDPGSISYSAFLLFSPISILAFPVSLLVTNPNSSILELTFWGSFLTIITFIFYAILKEIMQKVITKSLLIRSTQFVLFMIIVGVIRGLVFFFLVAKLNLEQPSTFNNRIINSVFTTLFWLSLANIVNSYSLAFKRKYQVTLNQILQSRGTTSVSASDENERELIRIQKGLAKSVEQYIGTPGSESAKQISQAISLQINEEIRPLSQRIWIEDLSHFPVINYKLLLTDAIKMLDYSKGLFLLSFGALALINNLFLRGAGEALLRTSSAIFFAALLIIFYSRFTGNNLASNFEFLIAIGLVPVLASELFVNFLGYESNWSAAILITPIAPVLIIILSVMRLHLLDRNLIIRTLADLQISTFESPHSRKMASYLHNSLQAELLALSSQLEEVALSSDVRKISSVLERVSALISRSMIDDFAKFDEAPLTRLHKLISAWDGIIDISLSFDLNIFVDNGRESIAVQAIEEIITNSFRHGKASKVYISTFEDANGIGLIIDTNGRLDAKVSFGIGSKWLDQISVQPVSMKRSPLGTAITLVI